MVYFQEKRIKARRPGIRSREKGRIPPSQPPNKERMTMKRLGTLILCLCVCLTIGLTVTDAWAKQKKKLQAVSVVAHSGYIIGAVGACDPGDVVPGALVYLPGWSFMAKADADGKFLLLYVPQGVYTLAIEIPGRPPFLVKDVEVKKQEFTVLGTVAVCHECSVNEDCPAAAFCAKEPGDCDGDGLCEPRPEVCPDVYAPVCGCDGLTYGNPCEAAAAGVSIAHPGECLVACTNNAGCLEEDYCEKALGDCEGEGVCLPRPGLCPDVYAPVCGCDDTDYVNACMAAGSGVSLAGEGECPDPE